MRRSGLGTPHLLALFVFLGVAPALFAAEPVDRSQRARELIERMARAIEAQDYSGVFVHLRGHQLESMRIVHRMSGGHESERLLTLNGIPREIIRSASQVTCIRPEQQASGDSARFGRNPLSGLVPAGVEEIGEFYSLQLAGSGRVAERQAQRVHIMPRDRFRYGYEFWIDVKTGLPLRIAIVGEGGDPVEQLMFVDLEVPARIPDERLEPTIAGEGITWFRKQPEVKPAIRQPSEWRVTDLPPGFHLTLHERRKMPGSGRPVVHQLYSDGLASVSVYIEQVQDETPDISFTGGSHMGAVNAYGRMVDGYQAVVVGKVPLVTVRRIALSIEHRPQAGE